MAISSKAAFGKDIWSAKGSRAVCHKHREGEDEERCGKFWDGGGLSGN